MTNSLLNEVVIFLGASVLAVPLAKRLGLGSVLGYLAAGVAIGPFGFRLIKETENVMHFAEFGVVMLLFLIGLELNPKTLWHMRKPIFGMGGLQVVLTTLGIWSVALLAGLSMTDAVIAGMALALSSTAIALQTMKEKNLLQTPGGRSGFAVLLFQDIAVIPMLALLPLLGASDIAHSESPVWIDVIKAVGVVALIIIGGHFTLQPLFRVVAKTGLREVFTAFSLLLVTGIAFLMDTVELSMALGTFLAGVLLADSEYRHQLEADIEPFKGLLLGLFFISVGMSVNFSLLSEHPWLILSLVAALVALKLAILLALGAWFKLESNQNLMFGFFLAQGGEFAFVLLGAAQLSDLWVTQVLVLVVALSMVMTPLLIMLYTTVIEPRFARIGELPPPLTEMQDQQVIVAGFGRVGQIVARLLHANGIATTVIDHSPDHIERIKRFGFKVFYGDASRVDLLETAGAARAKLLILATDNRHTINHVVDMARQHFPHLTLVVRAWDMVHVHELMDRKVRYFHRETFEAALNMGEDALKVLGFSAYRARLATGKFRHHDRELMAKLYAVHKDMEKVISADQEARDELERLFQADEAAAHHGREAGWR